MSIMRIFFDHLYFSVCCVLAGFLLVYLLAAWAGYGFDLDDNMALCTFIVVTLAIMFASCLTYLTLRNLPTDFIIRTKRQQ